MPIPSVSITERLQIALLWAFFAGIAAVVIYLQTHWILGDWVWFWIGIPSGGAFVTAFVAAPLMRRVCRKRWSSSVLLPAWCMTCIVYGMLVAAVMACAIFAGPAYTLSPSERWSEILGIPVWSVLAAFLFPIFPAAVVISALTCSSICARLLRRD